LNQAERSYDHPEEANCLVYLDAGKRGSYDENHEPNDEQFRYEVNEIEPSLKSRVGEQNRAERATEK
jgi:hypothetical protein